MCGGVAVWMNKHPACPTNGSVVAGAWVTATQSRRLRFLTGRAVSTISTRTVRVEFVDYLRTSIKRSCI
jgi:hypothetical protein